MINRVVLLRLGADMRNTMLTAYTNFGNEDAARMGRRYVFEIGQVMAEVHGDADAASLLYHAADALAAKLPLDDMRLVLKPVPSSPQPLPAQTPPAVADARVVTWRQIVKSLARFLYKTVCDSFLLGFIAGFVMGSRK
jgi:hypothetical protein